MATQETVRKMRRSFTLTVDAVAFVAETRRKRNAGSDSEALDMLLRELMLEAKRQALDASITAYYDSISDEEREEQKSWAEMTAPNMWIEVPE